MLTQSSLRKQEPAEGFIGRRTWIQGKGICCCSWLCSRQRPFSFSFLLKPWGVGSTRGMPLPSPTLHSDFSLFFMEEAHKSFWKPSIQVCMESQMRSSCSHLEDAALKNAERRSCYLKVDLLRNNYNLRGCIRAGADTRTSRPILRQYFIGGLRVLVLRRGLFKSSTCGNWGVLLETAWRFSTVSHIAGKLKELQQNAATSVSLLDITKRQCHARVESCSQSSPCH